MYDDIIDLAMDQQLLTEINTDFVNYGHLPMWQELHTQTEEDIQDLRSKLSTEGLLTFQTLFHEPLGYYFIKAYLEIEHSVDKAVFIRDIDIFKTLHDPIALKQVSNKIYDTFCSRESATRVKGISCLIHIDKYLKALRSKNKGSQNPSTVNYDTELLSPDDDSEITDAPSVYTRGTTSNTNTTNGTITATSTNSTIRHSMSPEKDRIKPHNSENSSSSSQSHLSSSKLPISSRSKSGASFIENTPSTFFSEDSNAIGSYGRPVNKLKERLDAHDYDTNMFDEVVHQILNDLKLDVFPRFLKSTMFDLYLRCKSMEYKEITKDNFHPMRMVGRGAFGTVNACKKKDTGRLYAMKQIEKRRVQATESVSSLIAEKEFLSQMDSIFVTSLKYAFADKDRMYLVMDLMTGGDLKYHLNRDGLFEEARARFYCAQILLGLEHIHSKGIIYRDLKLENVLVDEEGCVKISDLGLAVSLSDGVVRGYAGTPGYTAPEVVLTQYYSKEVDFFSFGVVVYRSLCGKKPFAKAKLKTMDVLRNEVERIRKTSVELDRNVVEMQESYESNKFNAYSINLCRALLNKNSKNRLGANGFAEIKEHPWFDSIDFGLLENGYLKAPFAPACEEIHAEQQQHIGKPPEDNKYAKIVITEEFEASLAEFTFKSSKVMQSELVEVLEKLLLQRRYINAKTNKDPDTHKLFAFPTPHYTAHKQNCLPGCIIV